MDFFRSKPVNDGLMRVVIRDPLAILLRVAITAISAGIAWQAWFGHSEPRIDVALMATFAVIMAALSVRAAAGGMVIDEVAGILELPGGGISANGLGQLFTARFLLQWLFRFHIPLTDINHIRRITQRLGRSKSGQPARVHYVSVQGGFGAARMRFIDEGKRDQAFALLREVCKAGNPVTRA